MLAAAHLINASLHEFHILREDKDIRHNKLSSFLRDESSLRHRERLAELIQTLEQLRPSHVYGKGENGDTAKKAEQLFKEIQKICDNMPGVHHER